MKLLEKNSAITLIALTVTVIVLLIISGVTISYLTGENGIINQSKESKKFAGTVEEKEVLNTSVAAAVGKSSKSKVEENNLKKYLNQNVGDEVKDYFLQLLILNFSLLLQLQMCLILLFLLLFLQTFWILLTDLLFHFHQSYKILLLLKLLTILLQLLLMLLM